MTREFDTSTKPNTNLSSRLGAGRRFLVPDDVLRDAALSTAEKRAMLSFWASDANVVADAPSLRQLEGGIAVGIDDILDALKSLDTPPAIAWPRALDRRRSAARRWFRRPGPNDDDDPPPSPACVMYPRRGGGGAVAFPEPAYA
ncbi:hypothetical protein [Mesorhizobium erdmanii]|uniref:Uncharacterized protein n=1 Tax=Mesorhizobium erdmanii TaxID=1777866 RepID=A0A6M7UH57_9HYPH|nr:MULTISPECIES: hypothetical protein [Mesorhizobium]OBQ71026.1 hypothetical protein A8146_26575 [Mesorhizobium loti]QKC76551.1 hypothetical protein EB233_14295 [Mesorhizobium erdmanii]